MDGGKKMDLVSFGNKKSSNGAIVHEGDNTTGAGDGDDEVIRIDLDEIPMEVKSLWIVVNVYTSSASFKSVKNAYVRLVAFKNQNVMAKFELKSSITTQGVVFARLCRVEHRAGAWRLEALGNGCGGRTATSSETKRACGVTG